MRKSEKGRGYSCVAISLYDDDLDRIDRIVADLRARGHRRANRSAVIRAAVFLFDTKGVHTPTQAITGASARRPELDDMIATDRAKR